MIESEVGELQQRTHRLVGPTPAASVVIPTRRRRESLMRLLASIESQDLDPDAYEVIVVVDGPDDTTTAALRNSRYAFRLVVLEQPHRGQAAARNAGAAEATGDVLVFIDDDMVLGRDYLRLVLDHLSSGADVLITLIRVGSWVPDTLIAREARAQYEIDDVARRKKAIGFGDVLNAGQGVRRDVFMTVGGFDEAFTQRGAWGNEDREIGYRMLKLGVHDRYEARAIVQTGVVTDPRLVLRRARQAGEADVRIVNKHPELASEVFGAQLRLSRIHRVVAPIVLRVPSIVRLLWPMRLVLMPLVERIGALPGWAEWALSRAWFTLRESFYWAGVAESGGRQMAGGGRARGPWTAA